MHRTLPGRAWLRVLPGRVAGASGRGLVPGKDPATWARGYPRRRRLPDYRLPLHGALQDERGSSGRLVPERPGATRDTPAACRCWYRGPGCPE